jgi:hypothetical protein
MTANLTDPTISKSAADKKRIELNDAGQSGLRIEISHADLKVWRLACRDRFGGMRKFRAGEYPGMGIAAARVSARRLREVARDVADPIADARRERMAGRDARSA